MSWMVYILECADSSLYTGITTDLVRRITEHETGKGARYTHGRGPFRLVHLEQHKNRAEASKREILIKAMTRARKLALIQGKSCWGVLIISHKYLLIIVKHASMKLHCHY